MSVEQTDQLIRLILNSTLLVIACAIVLSSLLMRHTSIIHRLRDVQQEYFELLRAADLSRSDRLMQLKTQLRHLRQHYQIAHLSVLMAQGALVLCISSTLIIAFRTFVQANWLIQGALVLFAAGAAVLLISAAVTLFDFRTTNHSLWEEINWTLSLGTTDFKLDRTSPRRSAASRSRLQRSPQLGRRITHS